MICPQIYNTILTILADFVQNIFPNDLDSKILKDLFNECLLVFRNFFRSNLVGRSAYKKFKDKKISSLVVKYVELISKINFEELYVSLDHSTCRFMLRICTPSCLLCLIMALSICLIAQIATFSMYLM